MMKYAHHGDVWNRNVEKQWRPCIRNTGAAAGHVQLGGTWLQLRPHQSSVAVAATLLHCFPPAAAATATFAVFEAGEACGAAVAGGGFVAAAAGGAGAVVPPLNSGPNMVVQWVVRSAACGAWGGGQQRGGT